jgi:hypothetical protein
MNRALNVREESEVEPAADGFLLLGLLSLQGWEIDITLHDLGVTLAGRKGTDEISRIGGSVAQVAVDFFKAAHSATCARELRA